MLRTEKIRQCPVGIEKGSWGPATDLFGVGGEEGGGVGEVLGAEEEGGHVVEGGDHQAERRHRLRGGAPLACRGF